MENFRLKVFRAVARNLNFSRAAEELLLTQPAVTQQIKALEDEYGVPLFDRAGGRIALTSAGQALLPYAERLKAISDESYESVNSSTGTQAGLLSLGASQTIGQYLLPKLIAEFISENPRVSVTAISGNTDSILESLATHRIHLAMVEGPAQRKEFRIEPFMEDQMVLVVPASHEWADQQISVDMLKPAPLLMREFGSGSRRVIEAALVKAGLKKREIRITLELDSTEGLLSAVEAGLGVAFVSRWAVRNQLTLGMLRLARVQGLKLSRMFSLVVPTGPYPAGNVGVFRRFLLAHSYDRVLRVTGRRSPK